MEAVSRTAAATLASFFSCTVIPFLFLCLGSWTINGSQCVQLYIQSLLLWSRHAKIELQTDYDLSSPTTSLYMTNTKIPTEALPVRQSLESCWRTQPFNSALPKWLQKDHYSESIMVNKRVGASRRDNQATFYSDVADRCPDSSVSCSSV